MTTSHQTDAAGHPVGKTGIPDVLADRLRGRPAPSPAYSWNRGAWTAAIAEAGVTVSWMEVLPDELDRPIVARQVKKLMADGSFCEALALVLIWGYAGTGYGPQRVKKILTRTGNGPSDVAHRLDQSWQIATGQNAGQGIVEAYRYLNNRAAGHIAYLGPSFFTKWLHFATADSDSAAPGAAPILDEVVRRWLNANTNADLHASCTTCYGRYIDLLTSWASGPWTPTRIEEAIFTLPR